MRSKNVRTPRTAGKRRRLKTIVRKTHDCGADRRIPRSQLPWSCGTDDDKTIAKINEGLLTGRKPPKRQEAFKGYQESEGETMTPEELEAKIQAFMTSKPAHRRTKACAKLARKKRNRRKSK
jgi:hypothetical protein